MDYNNSVNSENYPIVDTHKLTADWNNVSKVDNTIMALMDIKSVEVEWTEDGKVI